MWITRWIDTVLDRRRRGEFDFSCAADPGSQLICPGEDYWLGEVYRKKRKWGCIGRFNFHKRVWRETSVTLVSPTITANKLKGITEDLNSPLLWLWVDAEEYNPSVAIESPPGNGPQQYLHQSYVKVWYYRYLPWYDEVVDVTLVAKPLKWSSEEKYPILNVNNYYLSREIHDFLNELVAILGGNDRVKIRYFLGRFYWREY